MSAKEVMYNPAYI